jgi:hypothetical protein
MRVEHLLVDDVVFDSAAGTATVASTLYEFGEARWVSAHRRTVGQQLGPITLVETKERSLNTPTAGMHSFPPRPLHVDGRPPNRSISHVDTWTSAEGTVYTLVLPPDFIAAEIDLDRKGSDLPGGLDLGVSRNDRLFYWTLLMGRNHEAFEIRARLQEDPDGARELALNVDVLAAQSRYARLGRSVPFEKLGPDFWLRLLELGTKFFR